LSPSFLGGSGQTIVEPSLKAVGATSAGVFPVGPGRDLCYRFYIGPSKQLVRILGRRGGTLLRNEPHAETTKKCKQLTARRAAANELESKMVGMLQGSKACAELKGVRFIFVGSLGQEPNWLPTPIPTNVSDFRCALNTDQAYFWRGS
jgi:hypothetical protein